MSTPTPDPPPKTRPARQLSGMQILFASILAIGLLLAINFSSRIAAGQRLQQSHDSLEMEIATLEAEQIALQEELRYVQSDAYVETWAREEGKMILPGEVLIVPVPAGVPIPTPTVTPQTPEVLFEEEEAPEDTWLLWWALFFDGPPPF